MFLLPETILGVKITHIAAGAAGGSVLALLTGGGWKKSVTCVMAGLLTSSYLTTPVYFGLVRYFPNLNDPSTEHAAGFLVGLTALISCEWVMRNVKKRLEKYSDDSPLPAQVAATPAPAPVAPKAGD